MSYIDWYDKFTKGMIVLWRSAPDEPTVKGLEFRKYDSSKTDVDSPAKMNFYPGIMRQ